MKKNTTTEPAMTIPTYGAATTMMMAVPTIPAVFLLSKTRQSQCFHKRWAPTQSG